MMEIDEIGTLARMRAHIGEVVRPRIAAHRGHIVKTTGDGLLAEFAGIVEAVKSTMWKFSDQWQSGILLNLRTAKSFTASDDLW